MSEGAYHAKVEKADQEATPNGWTDAAQGSQEVALTLIEWMDSCLAKAGWESLSELELDTQPIRSVGWIVKEDDSRVALVSHQGATDDEDREVYGVMVIPKRAILERLPLTPMRLPESEVTAEGQLDEQ